MRQAFYTEPADQSGWLYHRWLLGRLTQRIPNMPALLVSLGHTGIDDSLVGQGGMECQLSDSSPSVTLDPLALFTRELDMCRDLDAVEPNCKWILLTTALLLAGREAISRAHTALDQQQRPQQQSHTEQRRGAARASGMEESVAAELSSLFARLVLIDPLRTNYYRDVHLSLSSRSEQTHTTTAVG